MIRPGEIQQKARAVGVRDQQIEKDSNSRARRLSSTVALVHDEDSFLVREPKRITVGEASFESIFTHDEAFRICNGLTNPRARIISRLYYESPSDLSNVAEAHKIATKTLNRYGPYKLKYVITLQPLPFKAFDAIPIFTELDRKHGASPIIRILHTNINGEYEELEIAFYINPDSTADRKRLQVTNLTTKQALMQIERSGHVIPEADAREIVPILQLFMPFSKDTKSLIISYGLETGTCGICGRTLTDEASIRRGVGPICASGRGWAD